MPFIEPPALDHWNVVAIELVRSVVEGLDGPAQSRGVTHIKLVSVLAEGLACLQRLLYACIRDG